MTQEPAGPPKKRRRWLRRIGWTLLILVAALLAVRMVAGFATQRPLNARLDALRAAGEPMLMKELAPPEVPPEHNAATLYTQAFAVMDLLGEKATTRIATLAGKKEPLAPAELDDARALLQQSADALRLIREGTLRPVCRFPVKYDTEPAVAMLLPHLAKVQQAARLLALSSEVNITDGKPDAAAEDCLAMFRLARSMHDEPILISLLVEMATEQRARQGLKTVLDRSEPSAEMLAKFLPLLTDPANREQYIRAMRGERAFGIDIFELLLEHPAQTFQMISALTMTSVSQAPPPPKSTPGPRVVLAAYVPVAAQSAPAPAVAQASSSNPFGTPEPPLTARIFGGTLGWLARPVIANDFCIYIDFMNRQVALAGKTTRESRDKWQAIEDKLRGMSRFTHPISRALLPTLQRTSQLFDVNVAGRECARAAVALRLYRLKHGSYPDMLDALTPEILPGAPKDPFTGANLIYRLEGQGFAVYSVGLNGTDDGGVQALRGSWSSTEGDIVWRSSR